MKRNKIYFFMMRRRGESFPIKESRKKKEHEHRIEQVVLYAKAIIKL